MAYTEPTGSGNSYRKEYYHSILNLVEKKQGEAEDAKTLRIKEVVSSPESERSGLIKMLGWPLTEYFESKPNAEKEFVARDGEISIYRMKIEVLARFMFYGILFVREDGKKRPFVISQHGGNGTPELCSSLEEKGSSNYNDMTRRILKYDVNVFAPQLLLWNTTKYKTDSVPDNLDRCGIDRELKKIGGSVAALEIFCLKKSIDYFACCDFVESKKIGMAGLSYGGFYTLYTSAVDCRIKSAIACSFFNNRLELKGYPDWVWFNSAQKYPDCVVAMLVYPRKLYIEQGNDDVCFNAGFALSEYEKIDPFYRDKIHFRMFNGVHEFYRFDEDIKSMISDLESEQ